MSVEDQVMTCAAIWLPDRQMIARRTSLASDDGAGATLLSVDDEVVWDADTDADRGEVLLMCDTV
ncbi:MULTISPECIES: hypothetical protein [unclassified Novosphingobium]|uniref:hypothetical protein n=1 Tax=unclassified Novosphingobium TaxID=2644732 RepID=UPI0025FC14AE|nr:MULTISPECIES: hypothetical protein [unclassified Novosphingobium]